MFPKFEIVPNKFSKSFDHLVRDKINKSKKANQPLMSIIRDILGFCKVRQVKFFLYQIGSKINFSYLWLNLLFSWKI